MVELSAHNGSYNQHEMCASQFSVSGVSGRAPKLAHWPKRWLTLEKHRFSDFEPHHLTERLLAFPHFGIPSLAAHIMF